MSAIKKYQELQSKVERAQGNADKAEGALSQVMERLQNEFNCSSLKQAQKKLNEMIQEEEEAKEEFETAVEEFDEEWGDKL